MTGSRALGRQEASSAVETIGWRLLLHELCAAVPVGSLAESARLAVAITDLLGDDARGHLRIDVREDHLMLSLQDRSSGRVTAADVDLAHRIAAQLPTGPAPAATQTLEIAVDASDIAAVRPFWAAVLGLVPQPGDEAALVDPTGRLPAVWFQQLDVPRPQRNRIHLDITVPHDEAEDRVAAALAAGGLLLDDSAARSFWILADAEGNEVCVCTWQDRDPPEDAQPAG